MHLCGLLFGVFSGVSWMGHHSLVFASHFCFSGFFLYLLPCMCVYQSVCDCFKHAVVLLVVLCACVCICAFVHFQVENLVFVC